MRRDEVSVSLQLKDAARCALFLDLDGTLIDIAPTPDRVQIPPDLVSLLGQLSAGLKGALAIVTGRRVVEINQFLDPLRLAMAGVHGAELRPAADGEVLLTVGPIDPVVAAAAYTSRRLKDLGPERSDPLQDICGRTGARKLPSG